MRVTQTISIGSLRINSMSNSSILQVGTSGAIKARSEDIKEYVTPAEAETKLEDKVTQTLKPIFKKEGLPLEQNGNGNGGNSNGNNTNATGAGAKSSKGSTTSPGPASNAGTASAAGTTSPAGSAGGAGSSSPAGSATGMGGGFPAGSCSSSAVADNGSPATGNSDTHFECSSSYYGSKQKGKGLVDQFGNPVDGIGHVYEYGTWYYLR